MAEQTYVTLGSDALAFGSLARRYALARMLVYFILFEKENRQVL